MSKNKKLTEVSKKLSARVSELRFEAVKENEAVVNLNVILKAVQKVADYVAYGKDCLEDRLQQSQCWQKIFGECITREEDGFNCISTDLKKGRE